MNWLAQGKRWLVAIGLGALALLSVFAGRRAVRRGERETARAREATADANTAHARASQAATQAIGVRAEAADRIERIRSRGHESMATKLERLNDL